jgi:hypothetical protein
MSLGLGMLQGAFNMFGAGQQHRRQKELMGIQFGNQQQLNRQGHEIQMDMWNKTNYGAQIEHMKKAGLNPALMYGMSGGGGTTAGSQGGGSASSGNAVQMHPMDMANLSLIKAQRDNIEADTKNKEADTGLKGTQGEELTSRIKVNIADAGLKTAGINLAEGNLRKINAEIEKINVDKVLVDRIIELDYGGEYGKNLSANIAKAFGVDGEIGLGEAGKIALAVGSLAVLRSPAAMSKIAKPAAAKVASASGRITGWLMKKWRQVTSKKPTVRYD